MSEATNGNGEALLLGTNWPAANGAHPKFSHRADLDEKAQMIRSHVQSAKCGEMRTTTEERNAIRCPVCAVAWKEHTEACSRHPYRPCVEMEKPEVVTPKTPEELAIKNARHCVQLIRKRNARHADRIRIARIKESGGVLRQGSIVLVTDAYENGCVVEYPKSREQIAEDGRPLTTNVCTNVPLSLVEFIEDEAKP